MTTADITFSLVVNTIDRSGPLRALLYALENQSYPHFEVIVVVGPTHDDTLEMLADFEGRVQVRRCPSANLSQSRNIGLKASRGDIVAYIDDDAVPSYHWLAQLARLFADPALTGTGGKVYLIDPDMPVRQHYLGIASGLAEQVDVRLSPLDQLIPPGKGYQWQTRMMGTNMAFRRSDLLQIGGFDEFYQWVYDDTDVTLDLSNAGKLVHPVKEAVVYHVPASSRNRKVKTFNGNWWIQTKAGFYFAIKHGRTGGNSWRDIILRCLHIWHGHLLWYRDMRRYGHIGLWLHWVMRLREIRGVVSGTVHGLRRLRNKTRKEIMPEAEGSIRPFQNEASTRRPAVDPVAGTRPQIRMSESPLRICLMSQAYPPHQFEGVGRHTNLMAQGLFELGHTVHVIAQGSEENVAFYDGAYVHRIPYELERYEQYRLFPRLHHVLNYSHAAYERVQQLMVNDGIQVVDSPLWQMDGLVTAVSNTLPVVLRLQTATKQISGIQQDKDTDSRLLGEMEQTLIQKAHYLVPNSKATVANVSKVYDVVPANYTLIPHGIVPVPHEAVRPFNLDDPPQTLTVLYVGRLEKRKGIRELMEAIPLVYRQMQNVRFVIVGADNSHQDGFLRRHGLTYTDYFAQRHAAYQDRVQFTGSVSEEELHRWYQDCDLFVAPSLYESFGLIYLEAMNYAKPVIGCRAGGIPEVVADGENGLLVDPGSADALAEALVSLLKSPTRLYEMGVAGRERLLAHFTYVQMARRFADVYRTVIQPWQGN